MKKNKINIIIFWKLLAIAEGIVILVTLFIGIVQNKRITQSVPQKAISPTPSTFIDPIPLISPVPNWKTYVEPDRKYTFSYPPEWGVVSIHGQLLIGQSEDISKASLEFAKDYPEIDVNYTLQITSYPNTSKNIQYLIPKTDNYEQVNVQHIEINHETVNEYVSTMLESQGMLSKGDITYIAVLVHNNIEWVFSQTNPNPNTFNQILKNFVFLQ